MRRRRLAIALVALGLLVAACTGEEEAAEPPPTPVPSSTFGPPAILPDEVDPCLLDAAEVSEVAGLDLPLVGPSGGEVFAICSYGMPETGGTADIALVDLVRVSEDSAASDGEDVDGEDYIAELTAGVGEGSAEALGDIGDGSAVLLSYAFGSQAWAYADGQVFGAYASDLGDDDRIAEALLREVMARQG